MASRRLRGCFLAVGGCSIGIVIALLAFVIIIRSTFDAYRESSHSMEPTLMQGDLVFIRPVGDIRRGDLVVFEATPRRFVVMKRVVALPGDSIRLRDGHAVVNGVQLNEPYVSLTAGDPDRLGTARDFQPITVPTGSYFVLGDNRDNSNDSRFIGFVTRESMRGRVVLVLSEQNGIWRP